MVVSFSITWGRPPDTLQAPLLSPSPPVCFSHFPSDLQGPDSWCSYLKQCCKFLPHLFCTMISFFFCPQALRYWVTRGGDEIFCNNTEGWTKFWKVFRENFQISTISSLVFPRGFLCNILQGTGRKKKVRYCGKIAGNILFYFSKIKFPVRIYWGN